jgi:hypothetical protein
MSRFVRSGFAVLVLGVVPLAMVAQPPGPSGSPQVFIPWANKFFQFPNPPAVITHDFGSVPHGTLLTHKLNITNPFDVPMQVIDIRKSCTCLEAVPPQQVLQPHESAELVLTMDTAKFHGPNAQTFYVTFGPQYVSTAVVRVTATSRGDVQLNPTNVNFGIVPQGSTPTQTVVVRYAGKRRDWAVTGVASTSTNVDVKVTPAGGEFRVAVTMKDGATAGNLLEQISLKTNDPSVPLLQFSVSAAVQAAVSVSPGTVRFEKAKLGEETSKKVILRATKPFKVQPVADGGDGVSIEPFPAASAVQVATIKFKPVGIGNWKRDFTLQTDFGPVALTVELEAVP